MSILLAAAAMAICPASGVRVTCVHDGDSIVLEKERIRIADIDTPELNGKCAYESRLAIRSRNRLAQLLGDGFKVHREGKDRYGRTLAIITVNGRSVGDMLVSEGLARTWSGRREQWC